MTKLKLLLLAALSVFHVPTNAQSVDGDRFNIKWNVESGGVAEQPVIFEKFSLIASPRLLPARLIINKQDILDSEGNVFVAKGVEFAFADANYFSACIINSWAANARLRRHFGAMKNNTCLQDADNDGYFEHSFLYISALLSVRATGKIRTVRALAHSPYEEIDPVLSKDYWYLAIYAAHRGGTVKFRVHPTRASSLSYDDVFGPYGGYLGHEYIVKDKDMPTTVDIHGAQFLVEKVDKSRVKITQTGAFANQNLVVESGFP